MPDVHLASLCDCLAFFARRVRIPVEEGLEHGELDVGKAFSGASRGIDDAGGDIVGR